MLLQVFVSLASSTDYGLDYAHRRPSIAVEYHGHGLEIRATVGIS